MQLDWPTAFWYITQEQKFHQIWDWWWNINVRNVSFHSTLFPGKTKAKKIFKKTKNSFWGHFGLFLPKKGLSNFKYYNHLPLHKKLRKTNYWLYQIDGWIDRWKERQIMILWDPWQDGGPIIFQMNKKADRGKALVASKHISEMQ